jgi:dihydroorotate dehydrogenase electron transfer subunit
MGSEDHTFEFDSLPVYERDALVTSNQRVAQDTFLLELQSRKVAAAAKPGQFVMVRAVAGLDPLLPRPFSICSVRDGERIHILYRVVGRGTDMLARTSAGSRISALGPLGRGFDPPRPSGYAVLVGGGMGIAPLVFLHTLLPGGRSAFLMGFPDRESRIPLDALEISSKHVRPATEDGSWGHRGLVTELLASHLSSSPDPGVRIYACGPPAMLRRVAQLALDHGISCEVSLEARMACGLGACQGCAVKAASGQPRPYYRVCREGPVFEAREIDWAVFGTTSHGKPSEH